jgi:hypothetical protein
VSSAERTSSGSMSGEVLATLIRSSSPSSGSCFEPGSISMNMSLRPVRGRSRANASRWIRREYSPSTDIVTTALPSWMPTPLIRPIFTPATRTLWP